MPEFVSQVAAKIKSELAKVIVGQEIVMEQVLVALLAQGHILLEGVPGTAKTLMAKSLAHVLGVGFNRVQFTPDLMPSDVLGTSVYEPASGTFKLRTGPIFTEILLADEINRTPPKTQAALLEAMEERQVTIDGQRHPLPPLFLVLATQNPVEYEGTYPLPEAQLDRFFMKVVIEYPSEAEEHQVVLRHHGGFDPRDLDRAGLLRFKDRDVILHCRERVQKITVEDGIARYEDLYRRTLSGRRRHE
ncbi:MAG: AAA family ATPase [candidate division NC10 bacterium]